MRLILSLPVITFMNLSDVPSSFHNFDVSLKIGISYQHLCNRILLCQLTYGYSFYHALMHMNVIFLSSSVLFKLFEANCFINLKIIWKL